MPSITPTMSEMRRELSVMPAIVATTLSTTPPPRTATSRAEDASCDAALALSAFWRTVDVICSIDAAVCCRLAACSSVRWLRSTLPVAICADAVPTDSTPPRTSETMRRRLSIIAPRARVSCAVSSRPREAIVRVRSPAATASATSTAARSGSVMARAITMPSAAATTTAATSIAIIWLRLVSYSARADWASATAPASL